MFGCLAVHVQVPTSYSMLVHPMSNILARSCKIPQDLAGFRKIFCNLVKNLSWKNLAMILPRSCFILQDSTFMALDTRSWQDLSKILARSCWDIYYNFWREPCKILLRSYQDLVKFLQDLVCILRENSCQDLAKIWSNSFKILLTSWEKIFSRSCQDLFKFLQDLAHFLTEKIWRSKSCQDFIGESSQYLPCILQCDDGKNEYFECTCDNKLIAVMFTISIVHHALKWTTP